MAVVQAPYAMTLGQQKIYGVIQQQNQQQHQHQLPIAPKPQVQVTIANSANNKRPLAPAPERPSSLNSQDLRCKRKISFVPYGSTGQQPASVARRNARERNRVKQVNNGFATLRQHIPPSIAAAFAPQGPTAGRGASKKLSKVETLRLAVEYIRSLKQMIDEHEVGDSSSNSENGLIQDNSRFFTGSPEQYSSYPILLPTPTCSEASVSPTPSHSSEGSFSAASGYSATIHYQENFENYEPKSPEDEELLDAIFSWQQNE